MKAIMIFLVLGLMAAGLLVNQRRGVALLQEQQASLKAAVTAAQSDQASQPAPDLHGAEAAKEEMQRLRLNNQELHALRNDVRQLREQKAQLGGVIAQNKQLREEIIRREGFSSAPATVIEMARIRDAGFATPEAALETFFWAIRQQQFDRFIQVIAMPEAGAHPAAAEERQRQIELMKTGFPDMAKGFSELTSVRAYRRDLGSDEAEIAITLQPNGVWPGGALKFRRVGAEWKLSQ
jgi:hypothetical protein